MRFLAGDVGGTKTLLAIFEEKNGTFVKKREERFVSGKFKDLDSIVELFLGKDPQKIDCATFGIAGPVANGECVATNLPWDVKAKTIQERFCLGQVFLLNDLEANAYGIKMLSENDLYCLNRGEKVEGANQALISAGTGLGEAPIFFTNGEYVPSRSEGGHSDFAPRSDIEIELLKYLMRSYSHVSYERVLSGSGLVNIFRFLVDCHYEVVAKETEEALKKEDPAKVISQKGLSGECLACKSALMMFCSIYGAEAGNLALKIMALNGVYIGGGIAPKILSCLKEGEFLKAFSDKGRFSSLLKNIPIYIILEQETALLGSLYYCKSLKNI